MGRKATFKLEKRRETTLEMMIPVWEKDWGYQKYDEMEEESR